MKNFLIAEPILPGCGGSGEYCRRGRGQSLVAVVGLGNRFRFGSWVNSHYTSGTTVLWSCR